MLTLHDGSVVPITDTSSTLRETENGYLWEFHNGDCSMTFPKSWESRFIIRGTTVYSLACFERAEPVSSLFVIDFRPAEEVGNDPVPTQILGMVGKEYVCAVYTDLLEPENSVLRREYRSLSADCSSIVQKTVCGEQQKFSPISMTDYMSAKDSDSPLHNTWKLQSAKNGKLDEQIRFHSDGTLTFTSDGEEQKGSWLVNVYTVTYDWNNQRNWGPAGLIFLEDSIYEATYYEYTPRTLDFAPVLLTNSQNDPLGGSVFRETE